MENAAAGVSFRACAFLARFRGHGPRPYCQRTARELAGFDVRKQLVGSTLPSDASAHNYESEPIRESERWYTKRCFRPTDSANARRVIDVKSRFHSFDPAKGRSECKRLFAVYVRKVHSRGMKRAVPFR